MEREKPEAGTTKKEISWSTRHDYVSIIKCLFYLPCRFPFLHLIFLFGLVDGGCRRDKCFIQDVVDDERVCELRVLSLRSSVFFFLYLLTLSQSLGLRPIDMEKTGLILIVVRRYISVPESKPKKGWRENKIKREKIWKARQWFTHSARGDRGNGTNNDSLFSIEKEPYINRACGKTHRSPFLAFSFLTRSL